MNHPADALKEIMFYSVAHLCFGECCHES